MYNYENYKAQLEKAIEQYATEIAKRDATFAENLKRKDKSFAKCADWIFRMAQAVYIHANGKKNGGMFTTYQDDMAQIVHYYQEDNEALEEEIKGIKPKTDVKPKAKEAKPKEAAKPKQPTAKVVDLGPTRVAVATDDTDDCDEDDDWLTDDEDDEDNWLND